MRNELTRTAYEMNYLENVGYDKLFYQLSFADSRPIHSK